MRDPAFAMWIRMLLLPVVLASLTGCASVFGGSRQKVRIHTIPSNTPFTVFDIPSGKRLQVGMTPAVLDLKRGRGYMKGAQYRLVFEPEGHAPRVVDVLGQVRAWYVTGNVVFGGLVGWLAVDPLTGGMWKLKPNELNLDFEAPVEGDAQ